MRDTKKIEYCSNKILKRLLGRKKTKIYISLVLKKECKKCGIPVNRVKLILGL